MNKETANATTWSTGKMVLALCLFGPLRSVLIVLAWVLSLIAGAALTVLVWPFRVLGGLVNATLGGGRH